MLTAVQETRTCFARFTISSPRKTFSQESRFLRLVMLLVYEIRTARCNQSERRYFCAQPIRCKTKVSLSPGTCFPALFTRVMFSHFSRSTVTSFLFSHAVLLVSYFPALFTRLHVSPRFSPGYMISRAFHPGHIFPRFISDQLHIFPRFLPPVTSMFLLGVLIGLSHHVPAQ